MSKTNWADFTPIDDAGAPAPATATDWSKFEPIKEASAARKLGDLGLSVAKGVVAVPEAAVGLADLVSGGRAGKFLENEGGAVGFRPKQAKEFLTSLQSDDLQSKQQQFQQADGVVDKFGVAVTNPSLIANAVAESVPLMGAGAVPARALLAAAPGVGAVGAGAIGEGLVGAGSAAEQIRQETKDGLLTGKQALLAGGSGAATAAFGAAGGKVAQRLGIADVDTALTQGTLNAGTATANKGLLRRTAEGVLSEGVLEELPQSLSEQALQNIALDKPVTEGLADAGVMGVLSGGVMGGGAAALTRQQQAQGLPDPDAGQPPAQPPAPAAEQPPAPFVNPASLTGNNAASLLGSQGAGLTGAADPLRAVVTPSQAMGIDPSAGVLSRTAAEAVDGPASMEAAALQAERDMALIAELDNPENGVDSPPPRTDLLEQVDRYVNDMGTASPAMVAAKFGIPVQQAQGLLAQLPPMFDAPAPTQGAANVRNADAAGALVAGAGGRVGADAARSGPDAGLLDAAAGQRTAGVAPAPGPAVQEGDAAPVPGRDSNTALKNGPIQTKAKVKGLKDVIARNKAAKQEGQLPRVDVRAGKESKANARAQQSRDQADAMGVTGDMYALLKQGMDAKEVEKALGDRLNAVDRWHRGIFIQNVQATLGIPFKKTTANVQNQSQGTPAAAPAPAQPEAQQAPPAVGGNGVAQPGAAPAGNPGVEAAGVNGKLVSEYDTKPEAFKALEQFNVGTVAQTENGKWGVFSNEKPAQTPAAGNGVAKADLDKLTIPEMTDAQLEAAVSVYGPDHKRTPKVQKEIDRRKATTTEPTNGTQADQALESRQEQPQAPAAAPAAEVSSEPNLEAAKALLARQKAATGNAVAEGKLRKELRDLAAQTPETDTKTVLALDTAATRLGMGEGRLKGLEFKKPESSGLKPGLPAPTAAVGSAARENLKAIAERLGVAVNERAGGFAARAGEIDIPPMDKQVDGALSPEHVFAHELGHAAMQKRGVSFAGAPINQIKRWAPNWEALVAASKAYRPTVWDSADTKIRAHARKPNEVLADAIGSVYLGLNDVSLLKPFMDGTGTSMADLGLEAAPAAAKTPQADTVNADGMSRADVLQALEDGKKLTRFGEMTWIEKTTAGKVETYVVKSREEGSNATFTKGPVGPDRSWGWGRGDAAREAIKSWDFPAAAPEPSPLVKAMNDLADVRARIAQQGGVVDDRLLQRERQLKALVKELEADGQNDELDAETRSYENKAAPLDMKGRKQGDMLEMGNGTMYRVIGVDEAAGRIRLVRNPDMLSERNVSVSQEDYDRLVADHDQTIAEARARIPAPAAAPAPTQAPAPAPAAKDDALSEREKAAKAKMLNAAAKLANLLSKNTRANITPEQEQAMLPIAIELFEGAMELGYVKFKQAAKYVRQFIANAIDQDAADSLPVDTLQGAYIAVSRRHKDKAITPKGEVITVDTTEEIDAEPLDEPTAQEENTNPENPNGQPQVRQDGAPALDAAPSEEGSGVARGGATGAGTPDRGQPDAGADSGPDGAGVSPSRGRGSRAGRVPAAGTGNQRVGRGRGNRGAGTQVPGSDVRAPGVPGAADPVGDLFAGDAETASAPNIPATNFKIEEDLNLGSGGEVAKFRDNIAAIETLKAIEAERRRATPEEQRILARFVGWGGLASAFPNPETGKYKDGWKEKGEQLRALLTPSEFRAASRSTRNAHYTSSTVVKAMWNAVRRMGYRAGLALETSMGVGNFLGLKPDDLAARFIGVEYDALTARMAKALYPQATVLQAGFQEVPLPDNVFDLSIGNPPFGDESLRFQFRPDLRGESIHNQFFRASLSALKPGGLQSMVVSRYLMDKQDRASRIALAREAELVAAIRLPDTAFKENARTEVVTDIIILRKRDPADKARMDAILDAYLRPKEKSYDKEKERRELANQAPDWIETTEIPDPLGGDPMTVNNYFAKNPGQVVGVMERSGSMRYKNDVTVRLDDPTTLGARLDELVAKLPENIVDTAADVEQATERAYQLLGEALSMAVAKEEAGHVKFNEDGGLTRAVEREFGNNVVLTRQPLTANSPWSKQLFLDDQGRWYKQEVKVDAEGKPVKMLGKDGKPTNRNVYERTVYQTEADVPNTLRLGETGFARLKGMVELRDLLKRQLVLETEDAPKVMMEGNRKKLAAAYEAFVAEHGPINRRANATLVTEMPDGGLILALEDSYEPERTAAQAKKSGLPVQKESAKPAPIMRERVVPKYEPPTQAETPADALAITLAERGVVDIERIAKLLNITSEEAQEQLQAGEKPLIFKDPETGNFETANAYLSGHVRRKLIAARSAGLQKNVAALEAIQPERWGAENVTVQIGSSWVPADVYADFGKHLLGGSVSVSFSPLTNTFSVQAKNSDPTKNEAWSSDQAPGAWILGRLLNSQSPVITVTDSDGKTSVDKEATSLAILKSREMVAEFNDWVFKDSARRERLVEIFNEKFNTRVTRQFDGSHLKLPGKVPDTIIKMRRHQMNAIWRGISSRFLLIDHVVGAGKTFTAIARAMERRRMGLAQKPAIVVPNHLIEQWQADVYRLYPGAKVLAASKADFEAKNRRKLFSRIATGDYDIVILPHSSLVKIGIAPETEQRYLEQELQEAIQAVKDAAEQAKEDGYDGFRKPMGVKEAERLVAKIEARMAKLREGATDRLLTFEQLGIDDLTIDEAHEFKNLFYSSRMTGTRGMGDKTGSLKASDLYNKVRVLRDNGGSVVFMTGTPVSNSVVELYTMMRYLASDDLRDMGMEHFDSWRAQFVEATPAFEPDESNRLKEVTRLGREWSNMRSMMDLYYQFTDAVSIDDIKQWYAEDNPGKSFPVPKVKGGDRQLVKVQPTQAQDAMLKDVIAGFDSLEYIKDPKERNAERLRLMDRARKLSLDARAADRTTTSNEKGGKLEKLSKEVKRIYDKWNADRGTQLVFLDRSVPKSKGDDKIIKEYDTLMAKRDKALNDGDDVAFQELNEALEKYDANEIESLRNAQNGGWNAYQQIKDNLVASGIPADEIRFIQEANTDEQKQALFDAVKGGKVRVLIGSTPRMGAGTNVQDRLVALHHADVTWKPSDIEQREGRIIRQGNLFATPPTEKNPNPDYKPDFEVEILAYATERTVDAKMWSLNATKLKAINGLRKYTGDFTMQVEDEESVSMAEMAALASGNPLLLERVTLETAINGLELQEKAFQRKMYGAQDALDDANEVIRTYPDRIEQSLAQAKEMAKVVREVSDRADARRVTVEGQEYATVKDALKAVKAAVDAQQEGNENARYAININGERVTNKAAIEDAIGKALGDAEAFEVDIGGATFTQRTAAGREAAAKLSPLAADANAQGELGRMFGFKLVYQFEPSRFSTGKVDLILALEDANGKTMASDSESGHDPNIQFTTSKLRDMLGRLANSIEAQATGDSADFMVRRLERARRDLPTLQERVKETFPKAAELKEKRERLKEVVTILTTGVQQGTPDMSTNPAQTGAPEANTADVVYSQSLAPVAPGQGVTREVAQDVVEKALDALGMRGVVTVQVVQNPQAAGLGPTPPEVVPSGGNARGQVYLFLDGIGDQVEAFRVVFHELFHLGLSQSVKPADYTQTMLQFLRDPLVRQYANRWKQSADGRARYRTMPMNNWHALAVEEALADIAEEINAERGGIGTKDMQGWVKRTIAWLADMAQKWGLPTVARRLRGMTYTQAEAFVQATMFKARDGAPTLMNEARFAQADDVRSANFRRWFGDSKVVDADGKALVVSRSALVAAREAASLESGVNGGASDAKPIADLLISQPFSLEGLSGLEVPAQRKVLDGVLALGDDLKILGAIVELVPVDVVNILARKNLPPETLFRDKAMLKQLLSADSDGSVATAIDVADALVLAVARMAAKGSSIAPNPFVGSQKVGSAARTGDADVLHGGIVNQTTGNNGQFDPQNPSIVMRSPRQLAGMATDQIKMTLTAPGKLSWWHKTVGTMYNLAERYPAFKPVFQAAQGFIDDVSYYATEAADMAPKMLPKLESWKDIAKSPISAEDNKAIEAPINEGTLLWARDESGRPVKVAELEAQAADMTADQKARRLLRNDKINEGVLKMWQGLPQEQYEKLIESRYQSQMLTPGVVWTDAELKAIWKLNDAQIGLYREVRAAIDKSLDNLAKSDLVRFVGKDGVGIKDAIMEAGSVDEAALMARDYFIGLSEAEPDRAEMLLATANGIMDRADKVTRLKEQGYAPLSRFGKYTVDVVTEEGRQYFGLFESMREANQMAARMRGEFGKDAVSQGTLSDESFKLFQGITPETLELFGNMLGLSDTGDTPQDQAFQAYLKLTKNNRSAMKRLIQRKGILGYSQDVGRVLANFIYSNARQTASALHIGDLTDAINAIPQGQGEVKDVAVKLGEYIKNPQEEAQAFRGLLFAQYLGGNISSAIINALQPFQVSFPYLSQFGGVKQAGAEMLRATREYASGKKNFELDLAQALKNAEDDGTVSPQEVFQLMAQAKGAGSLRSGDGTVRGELLAKGGNAWAKTAMAWGEVFGVAEQFNRRTTFIAAYRIAKAQKMADPAAFAKKAVQETQFIYSKANRPQWARGAIGATIFTFKTYSISYLELLHRMATQGGPEGKRAALLAVAVLLLMGGAGGLPFMEDGEDIADTIAQVMGYNFSSKQAKQELLEELFGEAAAQFIERGISGVAGVPIDVSGRFGMGNLVPGTGAFLQRNSNARDVLEVLGPAGDLARRGQESVAAFLKGDLKQSAYALSPRAIYNMAKGGDMLNTGMYRDDKGFKVIEATTGEGVLKVIGFQPNTVAKVQESNYLMQRQKDYYNATAQSIRAKWARGLFEKDEAMVAEAREAINAWNEKNPDQRMSPNMPAIWKRVREMAKDKDQRIADTAPKAMRQQFREETARVREAL